MSSGPKTPESRAEDRRKFIGKASRAAMVAGLAGGYGGFGALSLRYLYPTNTNDRLWQFVTEVGRTKVGDSIRYRGPSGEIVNIARQHRNGDAEDFIALSSTCPHLGCQVRWEAQNNRFYCPCHNGVFDPTGVATAGPPAEAGQSLSRYPLKVENGLLHISVPAPQFGSETAQGEILADDETVNGPGHDPCLSCGPSRRLDVNGKSKV